MLQVLYFSEMLPPAFKILLYYFYVVFCQNNLLLFKQTGFIIKQQVFDKDVPTPLLLFEFLQMLPVSLYSALPEGDDETEVYNPWKESDDAKVKVKGCQNSNEKLMNWASWSLGQNV